MNRIRRKIEVLEARIALWFFSRQIERQTRQMMEIAAALSRPRS